MHVNTYLSHTRVAAAKEHITERTYIHAYLHNNTHPHTRTPNQQAEKQQVHITQRQTPSSAQPKRPTTKS
jgi:hypothetical protein